MAKRKPANKPTPKIQSGENKEKLDFAFGRENYLYLIVSFLIIVFGFILMVGGGVDDPNAFYPNNDPTQTPEIFSFRRITLAPIVVLTGFVSVIWAIMKKPKDKKSA